LLGDLPVSCTAELSFMQSMEECLPWLSTWIQRRFHSCPDTVQGVLCICLFPQSTCICGGLGKWGFVLGPA
jgi:hypothetical protein